MELVRPNAEIWEQGITLEDMWKHIARCTRVCYQSTPKNDGETDEEFVKRVILRQILLQGSLIGTRFMVLCLNMVLFILIVQISLIVIC